MVKVSRKQREIQQREQLILEAASKILAEDGYLGLNMDKIAGAIEYSKGTIYQHFTCKEEVLCALALQNTNLQYEIFKHASTFKGKTREKMAAILIAHQLFTTVYRREFSNLQIIKNASIRDKISDESQQKLNDAENNCIQLVANVINDAIQAGELKLDISIEEFIFGLWSLSFGASILQSMDSALNQLSIDEPLKAIKMHYRHLLDGYGWQPLSNEWDYDNTYVRISQELFNDEANKLDHQAA